MANAIFTTKVNPSYDDLPEFRYHFPQKYLNLARQTIGDWIIYYEPRRDDVSDSSHGGRQCYFATARVQKIEKDPLRDDHYYAYVQNYLEFVRAVPFKINGFYPESNLKKNDGSTNKGVFGWAIRILPSPEYQSILQLGLLDSFENPIPTKMNEGLLAAEETTEYLPIRKTAILERPIREAAFTKTIQNAYHATCAMTGIKLINGGGRCEIEAAHIRPVSQNGPDSTRNGIALSRTVHWMFDRGILSITDEGSILMAKALVPNQVRMMLNPDGRIIFPENRIAAPHPIFLRYHRENIYKGD
jgi:putative restriction endonuclease